MLDRYQPIQATFHRTLSPTEEVEVRCIDARGLTSRSVWIEDWMRILPCLPANARSVRGRLLGDTEQAAPSRPTLGNIEHDF